MVFAPAERVAYNFRSGWALAVEEYADYGPLHEFSRASEQSHQLFGIVNSSYKTVDIEAGIGFGLTDASDHLTLKLILSHDFNRGRQTTTQQRQR